MSFDVKDVARRVYHYFVLAEGSTRVAGILRIGIVLLLWSRFAYPLILYKHSPGWWTVVAFSFYLSSTLLLFGFMTRFVKWWSGLTSVSLIVVLGHYMDHEPYRHHHVHLLVAASFLLAFTPCERSYSVDRWLALRRGRALPERGPVWAIRLMALQVGAVYFFGAVDKLNYSFLSGARMTHHFMKYYLGSDLQAFPGVEIAMMLIAVGTVVLEFVWPFGFYVRRLQIPLAITGVLFHLGIYMTLPVATFSATICFLYLAYFDPDDVHRFINEMHGVDPSHGLEPREG